MIIIDIEPEWGVKLYPKNEEDNERYKKFGFEDSDGRFYRSLFFSPRHRSLTRLIKDECEHLSKYGVGSRFGCGGLSITKIAEDEFEVNGHLDQKYLPEGIKFRISKKEQQ